MARESWDVSVPEPTGEFSSISAAIHVAREMTIGEYHRFMDDQAAYVVCMKTPTRAEVHIIQCLCGQVDRDKTPFPCKYASVEDARVAIQQYGLLSRLAECCFIRKRS